MKAKLAAAILIAATLGSTARAEDDHRLDEAWKAAMEEVEGVLTPPQHAALNALAYESAVARLCDGFKLNIDAYAAGVNAIITAGPEGLSDEQHVERQASILVSLGTSHGLFLAEGAAQKDAFCAGAAEAKADPESQHSWE